MARSGMARSMAASRGINSGGINSPDLIYGVAKTAVLSMAQHGVST